MGVTVNSRCNRVTDLGGSLLSVCFAEGTPREPIGPAHDGYPVKATAKSGGEIEAKKSDYSCDDVALRQQRK